MDGGIKEPCTGSARLLESLGRAANEGGDALIASSGPASKAGRSCGSCSLCCKVFSIDDPPVVKPAGRWCGHCRPGHGGCGIYAARPMTCRTFRCQWLKEDAMPDALRPDRCGFVLVIPPVRPATLKLVFDMAIVRNAGLRRRSLVAIGEVMRNFERHGYRIEFDFGGSETLAIDPPAAYSEAAAAMTQEIVAHCAAQGIAVEERVPAASCTVGDFAEALGIGEPQGLRP
ncbi:MAG TPA: YkgJ family cysteine cluster protein [Stellaceae bacterium]|nr:YkgJ family cysteine cluster protein [Stellaceae bacterium]